MEIKIKTKTLNQLLNKTIGVISPKQSNLIYTGILIEVENDAIRATSSNINLQVSIAESFDSKQKGVFVLPARKAHDILRNINDEEITLKLAKDDVLITSKDFEFKLRSFNYKHFNLIEEVSDSTIIKVQAGFLREAIKSTIFVSIESSNNTFASGVKLDLDDKHALIVSSDAYRLALYKFSAIIDQSSNQDLQTIIPKKSAQEMHNILQNLEDNTEITIEFNRHIIALNAPGARLVSKLLDSTYPNYLQLLSYDCKNYAIVSKEDLSHALRAVSVLADRENPKAFILVNQDSIELSLDRLEESANYKIGLSEASIDKPFQIEIVTRFLIEAIDALNSSQARIDFPDEQQTILVSGFESALDSSHVISLIAKED